MASDLRICCSLSRPVTPCCALSRGLAAAWPRPAGRQAAGGLGVEFLDASVCRRSAKARSAGSGPKAGPFQTLAIRPEVGATAGARGSDFVQLAADGREVWWTSVGWPCAAATGWLRMSP